jgi:hypothetical protein
MSMQDTDVLKILSFVLSALWAYIYSVNIIHFILIVYSSNHSGVQGA